MTLIWNIIQSVITILEIRVCVWMMEKFAEPRYSGKKQKIVVWIVTLGVGGEYVFNRWTSAYYSRIEVLTIFILLCFSAIWIFKYYKEISIFVAANYLLIGGLIDLIILCTLEILGDKPGLFAEVNYKNSGWRVEIIILSKILLFLLCGFAQKCINKKIISQLSGKKIGIIFILLCILEYVGVHALTDILNISQCVTRDFVIRVVFYLIVIILILAMLGIILLYYEKKDQLKQKTLFMESLDYENKKMIRLYREREMMYHDFKNHLLALDSFVQCGDLEQYQSYFERVKRPFLQKAAERKIGHSIMDLILNYKIGEAESKKIQVKCRIWGYMDFQPEITDEEACALLGNLWDNAIEACDRTQEKEPWIDFQMHIRPGKFLIEISNPYQEVLKDESGNLRSVKKEKGIHGIGMKTIRDIAERYHGHFSCILYDHVFKVEVMICSK